LQLDAFAIAEPADVGPTGGNGIKFLDEFLWARHVREIGQGQRDLVLLEEIGEFGVKPFWIANLDGVLAAGGQFIEEGDEAGGEGVAVGKDAGAELRKLEQDWSELGAKYFHGGEKFFQLDIAVREDFVVGDGSGRLDGKNKIVWSFGGPVFHGARGWATVESGVHFYGVKMLRVEGEKILGFYFWRVESALPAGRGKCRGAQINSWLRI